MKLHFRLGWLIKYGAVQGYCQPRQESIVGTKGDVQWLFTTSVITNPHLFSPIIPIFYARFEYLPHT